ncbi:MAG: exo-alpha-sialidase [Opitutus sp.]|nr:exo-alpha-sialidase [Opitutus sp.]
MKLTFSRVRVCWIGHLLLLPASAQDWPRQAAEDARHDQTRIIFDGQSPNKLACDTALRAVPDGSWVMVMLGGGDTEPRPQNGIFLTRSRDQGRTWSAMEPLNFGFKREGPTAAMVPSELMVLGRRCTLFFTTHDGLFGGWRSWIARSDDSCRTWTAPVAAPGRLHHRTFIRNHIVARDGRILAPFQHYVGQPPDVPVPEERAKRRPFHTSNPRNGVIISRDAGETWTEHGDIRVSQDDTYSGWPEPNIAELADGRIAMIIRADRLGGVLYAAESKDGGLTWPAFAGQTAIPNPGTKSTLHPLGGDAVALLHNPNPAHRSPLALWISFDGLKTWPYRRVLVAESSDGPAGRLNYPDGFVSPDKQWLHFAFDDNRHRAVYFGAKLPALPPP